jgi:hypothetical protein
MLRRWQWNFYRLENEHLGNLDQYRVTREVPLPYSFDDMVDDEGGDDDEKKDTSNRKSWQRRYSTHWKTILEHDVPRTASFLRRMSQVRDRFA